MATASRGGLGKRRPPPAPKRLLQPDWQWIEREWTADLKSTREIARESTAAGRKVSHVAIDKKAKKLGWVKRDLPAAVRKKVEAKLAAAAAREISSVTTPGASDDQIVEAAAEQGVSIVQLHRQGIRRARELAGLMFDQLSETSKDLKEIEAAIEEAVESQDKEAKAKAERRARLLKTIGLPARASVLRELTQAMRGLVAMERQAYNIDARHEGATLEDYLKGLDAE